MLILRYAMDECKYTDDEVRAVAHVAFEEGTKTERTADECS